VIQLLKVSKYLLNAELGHEVVLRDTSFAFPTDRPLALLGPDGKVLTAVLLMLTGSTVPDRGQIDRGRLRCSPVINAGGFATTLVVRLSGADNIRMLADFYGVDRHRLLELVGVASKLGKLLDLPTRRLDAQKRRALEVAAVGALPFDCYFIDRLHAIEPPLVKRLFEAAGMRGAGVIFSAARLSQATRLASSGVFASNGSLQWAGNLEDVTELHGQTGQDAAIAG